MGSTGLRVQAMDLSETVHIGAVPPERYGLGDPLPDVRSAKVAVVITSYNHAHYLGESIDSVLEQDRPVDEIIVVDDGSTDNPRAVTDQYPEVRLIQQVNQGLSGARNTGLHASGADLILFLDADDMLRPNAVSTGLTCMAQHPDAGMVYGGYQLIDMRGRNIGHPIYRGVGSAPYVDFLGGNVIGMHAAVLYRRDRLVDIGAFDTQLRRCEDYDCYLRMSRAYPVYSHPNIITEYRWHGGNMSSNHAEMLEWVLRVHDRHAATASQNPLLWRAWRKGRWRWRDSYGGMVLGEARLSWHRSSHKGRALAEFLQGFRIAPRRTIRGVINLVMRRLLRKLPVPVREKLNDMRMHGFGAPLRRVSFGDIGGVEPVSDEFGYDRGLPIDRGYIETFLDRHAADIKGRALEVGDDDYCRKFGRGQITQQDIIHVREGNLLATIVGDMSQPGVLPPDAFDVMVLTQTLHLVYDMPSAVTEMYKALKPGGVVLLTVPGITRIDRGEWGYTWYWSLTDLSARRLFSDVFGEAGVTVETFGNVYAATGFLQGLALEEMDPAKLKISDPAFPVIIGVRAQKPMGA